MKKVIKIMFMLSLLLLNQDVVAQVYDYSPSDYVWGFSSPDNIEIKITSFSSISARTKFRVRKHDNTAFGSSVSVKIRLESTSGSTVISIPVSSGDFESTSDYYYFASDLITGDKKYYATLDVGGYVHRAGPLNITARLQTPTITLPASGTTINGSLNINWSPVTQATSYRVVISESSLFTADPAGNSPFPTFVFNETTSNTSISANNLPAGNYFISIRAGSNTIYHSLFCSPVSVTIAPVSDLDDPNSITPLKYIVEQNFPNPFNPSTKIKFSLPESCFVTGTVYDLLGNKIIGLVNRDMASGIHLLEFHADKVPSGVYIFRLEAGKYSSSIKMSLNK